MSYAEYVLATQAANEPDAGKRNALIQALVTRNPQSKYLANTRKQSVVELASADPEKAVRLAEQGLVKDPENEEFLLTVAYYNLGRERDLDRVLQYSLRILELMRKKTQAGFAHPARVGEEEGQVRRLGELDGRRGVWQAIALRAVGPVPARLAIGDSRGAGNGGGCLLLPGL